MLDKSKTRKGDGEMSTTKDRSFQFRENEPISIYLAGPEVFLSNAKEIGERKKKLCAKYGFVGIFPIDGELNVNGLSRRDAGFAISKKNEEMIQNSKLLIANITPFRGPSADIGTAFEMGFAHGLKKIVCAYTNTSALFTERSRHFLKSNMNSVLGNQTGTTIEEYGLVDNLMLDGGIESSGGILVIEEAPKDELFTWLVGFEKCLKYVKGIIAGA